MTRLYIVDPITTIYTIYSIRSELVVRGIGLPYSVQHKKYHIYSQYYNSNTVIFRLGTHTYFTNYIYIYHHIMIYCILYTVNYILWLYQSFKRLPSMRTTF